MTEIDAPALIPQEHVLLHELNHRINNEFAAAISVVSLAAARSGNDEVKAALSGVAELLHRRPHQRVETHVMPASEKPTHCTPDAPRVLPCSCPRCGARMIVIEVFARDCQPRWRPTPSRIDTS